MLKSLILLLCFLLSVTTAGQTGRVNGKVIFSADGEPVIGAAVYILHENFRTESNVDGEFIFINIPLGTHTITAEYPGCLDTSITFTIDVNQRLNIDLYLDDIISARGARHDIANGDIKIIVSGGLLITTDSVSLEEEAKLASEYGFRYEYTCNIYSKGAEEEYNSAVYEYLDQRNGTGWRKQFVDRYNELKKR